MAETVEERLAKVRAELAVEASFDAASNTNQAPGLRAVSPRRTLLQRLVRLYEQQISYTEDLQALKKQRLETSREADSWKGFTELRPYSILLSDSLRESIHATRLEISNGEGALSKLAQLAEEQRTLAGEAEEKIRRLNEELESGKDPGERQRQREVERLRSQIAAGMNTLLELERQIREERLSTSRIQLALLQRQLASVRAGVTFSDSDFNRVLARLDAEQRQLESELREAESRRRLAIEKLTAASKDLAATTNGARLDFSGELLDTRRAEQEAANSAVACLQFLLQAENIERSIWEARFASYRSRNVETINQTGARLDQFKRRIELWANYYHQQLEDASRKVALQEERLAGIDPASAEAALVSQRLAALRDRDQVLMRVVRRIDRGDRLVQRLAEELQDAAAGLPFTGRVRNAVSDSRSLLQRLWRFELFVAQDTITVDGQEITGKRSVTLGKIISAALILIIGIWLTGLLSRGLEPIVIKRFRIDLNQANLIRRWFRVVLVVALALFSLVSVKIPLTVFAFAGGALVIGLGFGTQTLLKNFVSGVIILFERPFRVGDVLDVAGQRGTIVSIGIRSSVLQQWDGTETLIPNSNLLENSVTNWTYSNRRVRFTVSVGVAYGSDTRRVTQLLSEIAGRHGVVEKTPEPQVLFVNFGDSALMFELRFWVNVVTANASQVASDLRQMIAGTFAEHGIVIAFPQRDLHIDATNPLPVQILPPLNGSPVEESPKAPAPSELKSDGAAAARIP